jgi:hypothetical protein
MKKPGTNNKYIVLFSPPSLHHHFALWSWLRPLNDRLNLSFVKGIKVIGKKPTRYGHKLDFCQLQRPFMSRKFDAPPSIKSF